MTKVGVSFVPKLGAMALAVLLTASTLFVGLDVQTASAHDNDVLPTQSGGHDVGAADNGFWNIVEGMTTKTGFRHVFWWDTDEPVAGVVRWGYDPLAMNNVVIPIGDPVDSAQMAFFDIPSAQVVAGRTVHFQVQDLITGALSPIQTFSQGNAWKADFTDEIYEINAVLQIDTQALPDDVPLDQGLIDAMKGIDILAERVWDMSDGYARLGKVLITDTVLNYPLNYNQNGVGVCTPSQSAAGATVGNTLADFIITTQYPFDSHTFGAAINCPGWAFYVGRIGQLVIPWEDELHLGAVMAHEFAHYAFDADDLYEFPISNGCFTGLGSPPNNANGNYDISVMSNAFGWNGARWLGSEFDRPATPCDRRGGQVTWTLFRNLYPGVPALGRNGDGLPDHSDSVYNQAADNPDGGLLDVYILDNEVAVSKVRHMIKAPQPEQADPLVTILSPLNGAAVGPAILPVDGEVDRNFLNTNTPPFASLGASPNAGQAPLTVTFTMAASDSDGAVASWNLDFGDSTSTGGAGGPPGSVGHTYTGEGNFAATLTVTDNLGSTAQAVRNIQVGILAGATRVGTDPQGDTATTCGGTVPCNVAWVAGAKDGLDITALYVVDLGTHIRFIWVVKDGSKFFVDPSGDPTGGTDPSTILAYRLVANFQTSPATTYALNIERNRGSNSLSATLSTRIGPLTNSPSIGAGQNQGNMFWADVPKTSIRETAVIKELSGLGGSTQIIQRGASVRLTSTMDTLGTIENSVYVLQSGLSLPGMGVSPNAALPPPTSVPPGAQVQDPSGDVTGISAFTGGTGAPIDHMDIEAAWYQNDNDYFYIGLKLKDIPVEAATTAQVSYQVNFKPEWSSNWPIVSGGTFVSLYAEAILSPVSWKFNDLLCDDCLVEPYFAGVETLFTLYSLSEDDLGGWFSELGGLPLSNIDADTDIIWFVIPMGMIQDPQPGHVATGLSAGTVPGMNGLFTVGSFWGDTAVGPVGSYTIQGVIEPLAVDAGGPYLGTVGSSFPVAATPSGGVSPYGCAWSGPPEASFSVTNQCATAVTFSAPGDYTLTVDVTDANADTASDTAPVVITAATQERVRLLLDGVPVAGSVVPVSTSQVNPVESWMSSVDLTGAAFGAHTLGAEWYDEDDTLLDAVTITIEVTGGPPFLTIDSPPDGSQVEGLFLVSGTVGHENGPPPTPGGSESVTVTVNAALHEVIPVDTSAGDDTWDTQLDADVLGVGTHTIEATFDDGNGGLASESISVVVPAPPAPFVTLETPAPNAQVATPVTFAGDYSTTGEPEGGAGAQDARAAGPLPAWASTDAVRSTLTSPALAALRDHLDDHANFLTLYPVGGDGGRIEALFEESVPAGLPTTLNGLPIRYSVGAAEPLMRVAAHEAREVVSLAEFEAMSPEELQAWLGRGAHEGPDGPKGGIQAEIGPGTALQQRAIGTDPLDGQKKLLTFICTASYLFENPTTGRYYLATAGHCLLDEDVVSGQSTPAARARYVDFCVANCVNNWIGLGNYVRVNPGDAYVGYHPVAYAHQQGIGRDFGFIEIPASLHSLLRPWMWQWGGPTGSDRPVVGDPIVHFGHGVGTGATPANQGRIGVATFASRTEGIDVVGASFGGDSGSGFGTAFPRAERLVVGDGASGTLTHGYGFNLPLVGFVPIPQWAGTDLEGGLDMAQGHLGFRPALVTEEAAIRLGGDPPVLAATIVSPVNGAVLDPFDGRFANIAGTAVFPPGTLPGTATRTYYLHRSACGTTSDRTWMDQTQGTAPDGGNGCGSFAHPAGYVWEAALGELADSFPTDPKPTLTTFLDPVRPAEATMVLAGFRGVAGNPQPVPTVVSDMEVRLFTGSTLVGSQRLVGEILLGQDTPVTFSIPMTVPTASAANGLEFVFVVHEAAGPVFVRYGGPAGSFLNVPLGLDPGNAVELSIDDPTFTAGLLAASGSEAWSALWDLQGELPGAHTIYARARQGTDVQAPPVSVGVTLSSVVNPPTAGFVPTVNGLQVSFADASTPGDLPIVGWAWEFGDGGTSTAQNPLHTFDLGGTYAVRLVATDSGGYADDAVMNVEVGDDWDIDVRIVDPLGGVVDDWARAADPADGSSGTWSFDWDPAVPPPNGPYRAEVRFVRAGATEASTSGPFVLRINHAPILDPVGPQTIAEGQTLLVQLTASDVDLDLLTYSMTNKPTGATFNPLTGLFQWTPGFNAAGQRHVTFRVTDSGGLFDEEAVTITVTNTNRLPVWNTATPRTVKVGALLNFGVSAQDADLDPLTYLATALPSGATTSMSGSTLMVRWTPTASQVGVHTLSFTVSDGLGAPVPLDVQVTVLEDLPPTAVINGPSAMEAGAATFTSQGSSDPEGLGLTFAWTVVSLGDGSTLATGSANSIGVVFPAPGDYRVTLVARDPRGNEGTAQHIVRIDDQATLELTLVGDTNGNYPASQQAVVRACGTWVLDGAPIVGASVVLSTSLQGPGTTTVGIPTQQAASGSTGLDGCTDIPLPYDLETAQANLLGKHRVDGVLVSDSRPTDALLNLEQDGDFVHFTVTR